jgi:hypothetical protein
MILAALLAAVVVGIAPLEGCGPPPCPPDNDDTDGLFVPIGEFQSKDAGMRAAIKRLVVETERCPNARLYRIVWVGPFSDDDPAGRESIDRRSLLYWGPNPAKWLGYEFDVFSGADGRRYLVDRAAIEAVAAKAGTLEDFDQYDQNHPSTRKEAKARQSRL